jgi:acetyl esterase/lipase
MVSRRLFLAGAVAASCSARRTSASSQQVVRYGAHPSQFGTLHLPARRRPPVVCLLHGGFWSMPYGADQMTPLAEDLVRRGIAAWNIEYRRLGGGGGYPATLDDPAAAIAHLSRLATDGVDVDLTRIVAIGHSAGGHLALWCAAQPHVPLVAACGQAPVSDLEAGYRLQLGHGVVGELMGGSPAQHPDRYRAASPRALLPPRLPQLIVHGESDDLVPIAMSRAYVAAAQGARLRALPGVGHFEHLDPASAAWRAVTEWLDALWPPA